MDNQSSRVRICFGVEEAFEQHLIIGAQGFEFSKARQQLVVAEVIGFVDGAITKEDEVVVGEGSDPGEWCASCGGKLRNYATAFVAARDKEQQGAYGIVGQFRDCASVEDLCNQRLDVAPVWVTRVVLAMQRCVRPVGICVRKPRIESWSLRRNLVFDLSKHVMFGQVTVAFIRFRGDWVIVQNRLAIGTRVQCMVRPLSATPEVRFARCVRNSNDVYFGIQMSIYDLIRKLLHQINCCRGSQCGNRSEFDEIFSIEVSNSRSNAIAAWTLRSAYQESDCAYSSSADA